jgi:hypothetical protein
MTTHLIPFRLLRTGIRARVVLIAIPHILSPFPYPQLYLIFFLPFQHHFHPFVPTLLIPIEIYPSAAVPGHLLKRFDRRTENTHNFERPILYLRRMRTPVSARRKFTAEEDERLRALVARFGERDWGSICRYMPGRNPRQCRHRYNNYLVEAHKFSPWTVEEEEIILEKYQEFGSKWVLIAGFLCGRTGNDVKNRWHKHIGKRVAEQTEAVMDDSKTNSPEIESMPAPPAPKPLSDFLQSVLN